MLSGDEERFLAVHGHGLQRRHAAHSAHAAHADAARVHGAALLLQHRAHPLARALRPPVPRRPPRTCSSCGWICRSCCGAFWYVAPSCETTPPPSSDCSCCMEITCGCCTWMPLGSALAAFTRAADNSLPCMCNTDVLFFLIVDHRVSGELVCDAEVVKVAFNFYLFTFSINTFILLNDTPDCTGFLTAITLRKDTFKFCR